MVNGQTNDLQNRNTQKSAPYHTDNKQFRRYLGGNCPIHNINGRRKKEKGKRKKRKEQQKGRGGEPRRETSVIIINI